MKFEKWQACGNDFILTREIVSPEQAKQLCDRHYGIGADGVIMLIPSEKYDVKISIINSDGSIAEMCGNGVRCVGRYMASELRKDEISVETLAGIKNVKVNGDRAEVQMGAVKIEWTKNIDCLGKTYEATSVNVGNPHCVLKLDHEVDDDEVKRVGAKIENMTDIFPNKTNVEFVTVESSNKIRVKVWERGAGQTLACGTGSVASTYAMYDKKLTHKDVTVELDGGEVEVRVSDSAILCGIAYKVFEGFANVNPS